MIGYLTIFYSIKNTDPRQNKSSAGLIGPGPPGFAQRNGRPPKFRSPDSDPIFLAQQSRNPVAVVIDIEGVDFHSADQMIALLSEKKIWNVSARRQFH
jgi:hypothetical protein